MNTRKLHLAALLTVCSLVLATSGRAQAQVPRSSHVVFVMDENTSYTTTLAHMPWLVSLGTANGHTTNFVSDTSGSAMGYFWVASGSCESNVNCVLPAGTHNFGCGGNGCTSPITDDNIFRELNNHGISWKVYAQSYAAAGGKVTTPDLANGTHYYRRHNGATWYSDVLSNVAGSQARIVDFSQFAIDLANNALPQFSIIAPDGANDGHDTGPAAADAFLKANLPALLAKPYFKAGGDGLLIITFDNGDGDAAGPVYTALAGPNVIPNSVSSRLYKHENTFRTLLESLGLPTTLGAGATAAPMNDFFGGFVTVTSPTANAVTSTNVQVSASATEPAAQIYQLQVWDGATSQMLAQSAPGTSTFTGTVSLTSGAHQLIIKDISSGNFQTLHQATVNITVATNGVNITSPLPNAVSGALVTVAATASESAASVYQLQVWDTTMGKKLGQSAPGTSSINQAFTLPPGLHKLVVEDISTGTYTTLHTSAVTVSVLADGISITSPTSSLISGTQVTISASAQESTATVYNIQVWDATTGKKLGQSAAGTSTINQTYTLTPGTHQLVVEDISTGTYQILHQATITVTLQ